MEATKEQLDQAMVELKAQAYDILATINHLQSKLQETNSNIAQVDERKKQLLTEG